MKQKKKKDIKRLPWNVMCMSALLILLAGASPAYAENSATVKGSYSEQYQNVYTVILRDTEQTISLPEGKSLTVKAKNTADQGIRLLVTPVGKTQTEAYQWLNGETKEKGKDPAAFYVTFYKGSNPVSLNEKIQMSLSIPDGYKADSFWLLTPDGELKQVSVQSESGRISFTADSEGYYLFLKPLSEGGNSGSGGSTGGNTGGNTGSGGSTGGNTGGNTGSGGSTGGSTGGNTGSGSNTGNAGSGTSSSSGRDSGGRSNSSTNQTGERLIQDTQKGYTTPSQGILTGQTGSRERDGYSHWIQDEHGWWLLYADGTWAKGSKIDDDGDERAEKENFHWEKINGKDFVFGADGYARLGWFYEEVDSVGYWYYIDENQGRKTGWHMDSHDGFQYYLDEMGQMVTDWQKIDGKWYYFNPVSSGPTWGYDENTHLWNYFQGKSRPFGSMYRNEETPDGHFVDANGIWNHS